jgi:hypothetical protein
MWLQNLPQAQLIACEAVCTLQFWLGVRSRQADDATGLSVCCITQPEPFPKGFERKTPAHPLVATPFAWISNPSTCKPLAQDEATEP